MSDWKQTSLMLKQRGSGDSGMHVRSTGDLIWRSMPAQNKWSLACQQTDFHFAKSFHPFVIAVSEMFVYLLLFCARPVS